MKRKNQKIKGTFMVFLIICCLAGCAGKDPGPAGITPATEDDLEEEPGLEMEKPGLETEEDFQTTEAATSAKDSSEADYDLTVMNSDMVYATVYQMMVDPDTYIRKTFRMEGTYYAAFFEPTGKYYHYCIIRDAMACCAQGMEFVWENGTHDPEEYPEENADIIVKGTFETYREEGDSNLYCRLRNATVECAE